MPSRKTDTPPAEPVREVQLAENRKAHFDYQIERRLEAGIALRGTEIKSLRAGHANLRDGYARVENGEVWLRNVHIAPWANSAHDSHDPLRPRKLLLHKDEMQKLIRAVEQQGVSLIPLSLYFKDGYAKVELATGRGKKDYDKRHSLAERQANREAQRALSDRNRRH